MELDDLRIKLMPYNHQYKIYKPEELVTLTDYTNEIININEDGFNDRLYRTKEIVAEDVLGYCETHDIDLNIYRYYYTMPVSKNFFDPITLEWNIIVNGHSVDYYMNDLIKFEKIKSRVPLIEYKILNEDRTTLNEEYQDPVKLKEYLDKLLFMHPNKIPLIHQDDEIAYAMKGSTPTLSYLSTELFLRFYPNLPRYGVRYENPNIDEYDDDITNHKVFHEDKEFLEKQDRLAWPRFRFAIIHDHLYIFAVQSELEEEGEQPSKINSLYVIEPTVENAKVLYEENYINSSEIFNDEYAFFYKINKTNNTYSITYTPSNITPTQVRLYHKYIRLTNTNLEKVITDKVHSMNDRILSYYPDYDDSWVVDNDTDKLKNDFVIFLLSNVHLVGHIYVKTKKQADKLSGIKLWDLSSVVANQDEEVLLLYRGDIEQTILDYISLLNDYEEIPEVLYRDEINIFNEITGGQFTDLIPTINMDFGLKEDWNNQDPTFIANKLMDNDYDLFMAWHKVNNNSTLRLMLNDAVTVKETQQLLEHHKIVGASHKSSRFVKFAFPNYNRKEFDLYIGNILYTGTKIVEREHHWTYVYISIPKLYKFLLENKLLQCFIDDKYIMKEVAENV